MKLVDMSIQPEVAIERLEKLGCVFMGRALGGVLYRECMITYQRTRDLVEDL